MDDIKKLLKFAERYASLGEHFTLQIESLFEEGTPPTETAREYIEERLLGIFEQFDTAYAKALIDAEARVESP